MFTSYPLYAYSHLHNYKYENKQNNTTVYAVSPLLHLNDLYLVHSLRIY